jgi:hypothetical protein
METSDQLPFVVHVDDADEPGDVLDSLALEPFIAGRHRVARTQQLSRVRADAPLFPDRPCSHRLAEANWRTVVLSEGEGWMLKAMRYQDHSATLVVTAVDNELAQSVLAEVAAAATGPPDQTEAAGGPAAVKPADVGFWHLSGRGPLRSVRAIETSSWDSIRRNYTAAAAAELEELMTLSPPKLTGRLLLLHGPPGTGKTSVIRTLAHEWRDWCGVDCVLDPERLLRDVGYLTSLLLSDRENGDPGNCDPGDTGGGDADGVDRKASGRWRLFVLEDCDEVIRSESGFGSGQLGRVGHVGQALSRLLNVTDGLLGQGRNVLICITTNDNLFHPAVVRPGRCLKQIEIGPLDREEAAAWLGVDPSEWATGATLAQLYAVHGGYQPAPAHEDPSIGQYL